MRWYPRCGSCFLKPGGPTVSEVTSKPFYAKVVESDRDVRRQAFSDVIRRSRARRRRGAGPAVTWQRRVSRLSSPATSPASRGLPTRGVPSGSCGVRQPRERTIRRGRRDATGTSGWRLSCSRRTRLLPGHGGSVVRPDQPTGDSDHLEGNRWSMDGVGQAGLPARRIATILLGAGPHRLAA